MQACTRCLYTSRHPLHLTFDAEGVCSGCRVHEEKDRLDWTARGTQLGSILDEFRNRSGNNYDCIVPVSGARDSYFIVHKLKAVLGMNPLLVTYNKQYNTDVGVRNLANLRTRFDCDIMTLTVNPDTVKRITRSTMRRFGSLYWHCIAGQTVYPVQIATKFKIPLIVWGAHQGIDQVGMFSHLDEVEMTRKYRKEHDLMGLEAEDLVNEFDNVTEIDMRSYFYPDNREIERVGVRGIYLNNFIRWDSRAQHEEMIRLYGYEAAPQTRTFDSYNDVDCWNYSDVHDYVKVLKHGYGKVTDHACREIRLGRLSRAEGAMLVAEYGARPPRNLRLLLEWLGITESAFHYIIDQHRNSAIWKRDADWNWTRIDEEGKTDAAALGGAGIGKEPHHRAFETTPRGCSSDSEADYILIGKGAPQN
jgi:N-acetyl sugar amidotransferase